VDMSDDDVLWVFAAWEWIVGGRISVVCVRIRYTMSASAPSTATGKLWR
jgi:hypothetical protein